MEAVCLPLHRLHRRQQCPASVLTALAMLSIKDINSSLNCIVWLALLACDAGQELVQAIQRAQLQLAPADMQRLASVAARNDVAMLNYKKLTRQLKGHLSRPASALSAQVTPATAAQPGTSADSAQGVQVQQRPQSAMPAAKQASNTLPEQGQTPSSRNSSSGVSSIRTKGGSNRSSRPSSAPARPHGADAASGSSGSNVSREEYVCARAWGRNNREGVSVVSHWFCGSRRDAAAADETAHWMPGHAADAITRGWGLNGPAPWDGAPAAGCCAGSAAAADGAAAAGSGCGNSQGHDVVPAWMIGADALHGTCRIRQPFGETLTAAAGAAAVAAETDGDGMQGKQVAAQLAPADLRPVPEDSHCRPASAGVMSQRPASAGPSCMRPGTQSQQQQQQQHLWDHVDSKLSGRRQQQQRPMSAVSAMHSSPNKAAASSGIHRPVALGLGELMIMGRSSSGVGLAERRRLVQSQQQDLLAVRMLS